MFSNVHILFVGKEDWSKKYEIPAFVNFESFNEHTVLPNGLMDLVILDRDISNSEKEILWRITRGYCLFATENVQMKNTATKSYFEGRMGQYLYTEDAQFFLDHEVQNYYPNPYGEKFNPNMLEVSQFFAGKISYNGNYDLLLEGDFGEEFTQIVYWRNNIPILEEQGIDLYLEYKKTGSVEIKLRVLQFYNGSIEDIKKIWEFNEKELSQAVRLDNDDKYGPVFVSILAKGEGSLNIISLHDRYSRRGQGFFLPGGERLVSSGKEEAFTYFERGDGKPPIALYFSGYRKQEGFEGYYMMRKFGCPFMLITDPRLEGGSFYVGDAEFEELLLKEIRGKIRELGFTGDDVILSGASMGTYGSLYYGSKLAPHALILAKPLANMGNVAKNERIFRPGVFPTSLDVILKHYRSLNDDAILAFNDRLWSRFGEADWSHTKFIVSYLYEDDYDPDAYRDILTHLRSEGVEVYGKGAHGRHNDNTETVMEWFKSQYKKILREDFGRK